MFKEQQADRDFVSGKDGAVTSAQVQIEKVVIEMTTPTNKAKSVYKGIPSISPKEPARDRSFTTFQKDERPKQD